MPLRIVKFSSLSEANLAIAGALIGARVGTMLPGLVGETLTFASPAGSHRFTQPSGAPSGLVPLGDVKSQLEGAIAGLRVQTLDGRIVFRNRTAGQNVSLAALNERARTLLGFATNVALAGEKLGPVNGPAPRVIEMDIDGGTVYLLVEDPG